MKLHHNLPASRLAVVTAVALLVLSAASAWAAPRSVSPFPSALEKRFSGDRTGRVIVGTQPGVSASALDAAEEMGAQTVSSSARAGFAVVEPPQGVSAEQFAQAVEGAAGVRYAEPERVVRAAYIPTDSFYAPYQWNLKSIGCEPAWDRAIGVGVKVAVLDTGIMSNHLDLAGQVIAGKNFVDPDDPTNWADDDGHGTHVAGIIAAKMNGLGTAGIAPHAKLLAGKVLDSYGSGNEADLALGIRWAADNGADIINMSITSLEYAKVLEEACEYARSKGCLIVAAAGNEQTNRVSYPAVLPGVISVGSVGQATATPFFKKSGFSNHGYELDIVAPGEDIMSTVFDSVSPLVTNGYDFYDGTSMASPHVAGVLALARQLNPTLSRAHVERALMTSALDIGEPGRDRLHGAGVVQAASMAAPLAATDVDGFIPGLPLSGSSVSGTLDWRTDTDDVYEVHVVAGDLAQFTLTADSGTDFRLELFNRRALSTTATPVAVSAAGYPGLASVTPTESGSIYVRVRAQAGAGSYRIANKLPRDRAAHPDDDIPGVAPAGTKVTDTLDRAGDMDDVYAIPLTEGQGITVGLTAEEYSDFDLYLFSPEASSVHTMTGLLVGSANDGSKEELSFSAPPGAAGTHYVNVKAYTGGGAYTLTYKKGTAAKLSLSGPSTCEWGGSATVSGKLLTYKGKAVSGRTVSVWSSRDKIHWTRVASTRTGSTGYWKASVKPKRKTFYLAEFEGDRLSSGATYTYTESPLKTITPRAYLTRPYAPTTTYRGRVWTASGYLRPKHPSGEETVKITCYRYENRKWVVKTTSTVYAKNSDYSAYTTKYKVKMSLPSRGKWKLVASVTGDSAHATTKSSARYVTVK